MVHLLHRPATPDEQTWDEMNRRFNEFAVAINAELKRLNLPIPPGAPQT